MGRPKGAKNKPKAKTQAKAKASARVSKPDTPPDWLRKAMAVKTPTKPKVGRKPDVLKAKFKAITTKARRGKTMAKQPVYDPMDDPDLRAGTKGDLPPPESPIKPPTGPADPGYDKPGGGLAGPKPGHNLPKPRRKLGTREGERDEIDADKVENVIADTLGGSGDQHSRAQQILRRFDEAGWIVTAGGEGEPSESIQVILDDTEATRERENLEAEARAAREDEARQAMQGDRPEALRQALEGGGEEKAREFNEGRGSRDDPKGADAGKGRSKDDPKGADDGKSTRA